MMLCQHFLCLPIQTFAFGKIKKTLENVDLITSGYYILEYYGRGIQY